MTRRVILLHGLWLHGASMRWIGARLRETGFEPVEFSYASVGGGPDAAVPKLVDLIGDDPAHLVAHSLGGLIALTALRKAATPVERVVCLGTPLCGSNVATALMANVPFAATMLGRSASLLQSGCTPWTGAAQVGSVAGRVARGLGQVFARFDGESDGTVAVRETRMDGLADHVTIAASHSGLLFSAEAARQSAAFLHTGRFVQ